jgi:hypothetical protein
MKRMLPLPLLLLVILLDSGLSRTHAQSSTASDALFKTVQSLDTKFFDAYNHCDLATLSSLVDDDLEFYHDLEGLSRGRQTFVEAIKSGVCGQLTRELVPGTLQVYPIAQYGAVEIGIHRFHFGQGDKMGEAKFIDLWQNKNGSWKVTRVISFDHHLLTK